VVTVSVYNEQIHEPVILVSTILFLLLFTDFHSLALSCGVLNHVLATYVMQYTLCVMAKGENYMNVESTNSKLCIIDHHKLC
jgi:hypothetical protein